MFKKLLLFTGLFGALLGSCRQEDANRLADDATTPAGPGVELLLDFGADQLRETPTSPPKNRRRQAVPLTMSSTMRRMVVRRRPLHTLILPL